MSLWVVRCTVNFLVSIQPLLSSNVFHREYILLYKTSRFDWFMLVLIQELSHIQYYSYCSKMHVVISPLCTGFLLISLWGAAILIFNVFYRISSGCWKDFNTLWLWQLHSLELDYRIFYCERHKGCRLHCFWSKYNTKLSTSFLQCRYEGSRKIKNPKLLHVSPTQTSL